jgi:predicted house-cleaning noncanonical NTP pyrophosphatase (MazG superfamily)
MMEEPVLKYLPDPQDAEQARHEYKNNEYQAEEPRKAEKQIEEQQDDREIEKLAFSFSARQTFSASMAIEKMADPV